MIINKRVGLLVVCLLVLLALLFFPSISFKEKGENYSEGYGEEVISGNAHELLSYDEQLFQNAVNSAEETDFISGNVVKGGIIPHHLLASDMIANFYKNISDQDIETVIILGPNHYEEGNFVAIGSDYPWKTPFGVVEPDSEIIDDLEKNNLIEIDEEVSGKEHSVASHMPFIKYYLPEAKVVPIILSARLDREKAEILSEKLAGYLEDDKVIMIASVDFSHYLQSDEATKKDIESLEAMKSFNYEKIYSFDNSNLDSSPSIVTLLMTMSLVGINDFEVLGNTNSGIMVNDISSETTSYFSIAFR